mmetsp:Transcript_54972/g.134798  ORF Transcript_54972/g.134798 Transcript_54972/m.134798 type:complete len:140 (+) Transcript_54972:3-422(+)
MELLNLVLLNPDYELDSFVHDFTDIYAFAHRTTIYADRRDRAVNWPKRMTGLTTLGQNVRSIIDPRTGRPFDIDIVDTSDLQLNIGWQSHAFFNVNRSMVDDLASLIVENKAASERRERLRRIGGVYRFSLLPKGVVEV